LAMLFTILLNLFYPPLARYADAFFALYFLLIFFHAFLLNQSIKIAFLSVIASFIQLTAYGLGFMQDFWKRLILKQS